MLREGQDSARRCAVWGSPVAHSLSPVLHRAAYAALGLDGWTYDRRDVDVPAFADTFAALDETWRGLSLTMPLKEVALRAADTVSPLVAATGAANTLVRDGDDPSRWAAHNTDVHGISTALRLAGADHIGSLLVIGSGATARSALASLSGAGSRVVFMVRGSVREATLEQAIAAGVHVDLVQMGEWDAACEVDAVVSTVPPAAVRGLDRLPTSVTSASADRAPVLLDVIYGSGETPLQRAARERGWSVAEGTDMLLHQASEQVRLMTGQEPPLDAMAAALADALAAR